MESFFTNSLSFYSYRWWRELIDNALSILMASGNLRELCEVQIAKCIQFLYQKFDVNAAYIGLKNDITHINHNRKCLIHVSMHFAHQSNCSIAASVKHKFL